MLGTLIVKVMKYTYSYHTLSKFVRQFLKKNRMVNKKCKILNNFVSYCT